MGSLKEYVSDVQKIPLDQDTIDWINEHKGKRGDLFMARNVDADGMAIHSDHMDWELLLEDVDWSEAYAYMHTLHVHLYGWAFGIKDREVVRTKMS